jgi:hypothetical protein
MTRAAPLLALLFAFGCAQAPAQNNQRASPTGTDTEQQAIMDRIERDVRLPEGAGALSTYSRIYAWHEGKDGTRTVVGYYQNLLGTPPGRRWGTERDFPGIADGGCGVVRFSYDVATQRIENISCNGYA